MKYRIHFFLYFGCLLLHFLQHNSCTLNTHKKNRKKNVVHIFTEYYYIFSLVYISFWSDLSFMFFFYSFFFPTKLYRFFLCVLLLCCVLFNHALISLSSKNNRAHNDCLKEIVVLFLPQRYFLLLYILLCIFFFVFVWNSSLCMALLSIRLSSNNLKLSQEKKIQLNCCF